MPFGGHLEIPVIFSSDFRISSHLISLQHATHCHQLDADAGNADDLEEAVHVLVGSFDMRFL